MSRRHRRYTTRPRDPTCGHCRSGRRMTSSTMRRRQWRRQWRVQGTRKRDKRDMSLRPAPAERQLILHAVLIRRRRIPWQHHRLSAQYSQPIRVRHTTMVWRDRVLVARQALAPFVRGRPCDLRLHPGEPRAADHIVGRWSLILTRSGLLEYDRQRSTWDGMRRQAATISRKMARRRQWCGIPFAVGRRVRYASIPSWSTAAPP